MYSKPCADVRKILHVRKIHQEGWSFRMFPLLMNIHDDTGLHSCRDNPTMPGNKFCSDVDKNLHSAQSYSNAGKALHVDKMLRHSLSHFSIQKFN